MTLPYVWHSAFIYVIWWIHMCHMTCSYSDMTHSRVWHDVSFVSEISTFGHHMNEPCHVPCEWVMSRRNMSCPTWMSQVNQRPCGCVVSHVNESCPVPYEWVMSRRNMSCPTWMSHANQRPCGSVVSHMNELFTCVTWNETSYGVALVSRID